MAVTTESGARGLVEAALGNTRSLAVLRELKQRERGEVGTKKTGRDICKLTSSERERGELIVRSKCLMLKAFRGWGRGRRSNSIGE